MRSNERFSQSDYDTWQERRNKGETVQVIAYDYDCNATTIRRNTDAPKFIVSPTRFSAMLLDGHIDEELTIVQYGKILGTYTPRKDETNG